jgi:integrase
MASQTFDKQKRAQEWHDEQKRSLAIGEFVDPKAGKVAVRAALDSWMLSRAGTVASSTFRADANRLRYVPDALARRPLGSIRPADIQNVLNDLSKRGLSPNTISRVRSMFGAFFAWARLESIVASDPVRGTVVPKGLGTSEAAEVYPFTLTELREVAASAVERSPSQGQVVLILGLTGLRWGELCALRARDVVSVPHPALRVTRSGPDGHEIRSRTKGGRARSIPLAAELVPVVAAWAAGKAPDDLLFTTDEGHRLNNSNWRRIVGWSKVCRGRRIHDLRHTAATLWLTNGLDIKTVQQWLGHASGELTLNLYGHWMGTDADAGAIARINAALSGSTNSGDAGGTQLRKLRAAKRSTSQ